MDVTCPHCAMVMTEDEAVSGICPGCRKRMRRVGRKRAKAPIDPQEIASRLTVDERVSSLTNRRRAGPSQRAGGSFARNLAWGAVAAGMLPWSIFVIAILETRFPHSMQEIAADRFVYALVSSGITVVAGLTASLTAAEDDSTTRQVASVAVVLASFTILIAVMMLVQVMR